LTCRPYLVRELALLKQVRVVVALGSIGLDAYLSVLKDEGRIASRAAFKFGHGSRFQPAPGEPEILVSYHPSQQNTSTGKLTAAMLRQIFDRARSMIEGSA